MSTRSKRLALALVLLGGLLGLFGIVSLPLSRYADADDKAADKDTREADRAGIQAHMESFVKAFESGDTERVASFWTVGGELIDDDGSVHRGRAAIAKAYRELFDRKEKVQAEVQRDSLRFPS